MSAVPNALKPVTGLCPGRMSAGLIAVSQDQSAAAWRRIAGSTSLSFKESPAARISAEALAPVDPAFLARTIRDFAQQGCRLILLLADPADSTVSAGVSDSLNLAGAWPVPPGVEAPRAYATADTVILVFADPPPAAGRGMG